jgi:hypothetical protein
MGLGLQGLLQTEEKSYMAKERDPPNLILSMQIT